VIQALNASLTATWDPAQQAGFFGQLAEGVY
jgi:hypothetical protein